MSSSLKNNMAVQRKRLLIDGTALSRNPKGVGRYAYNVCMQTAALLSDEWEIYILLFNGSAGIFPSTFRGKLVPTRRVSSIVKDFYTVPRQIARLGAQVLLRPMEGVGYDYGIPMITVCHDLNELIIAAKLDGGEPPQPLKRRLINRILNLLVVHTLRKSSLVICNSDFVGKSIIERYGISFDRTAIGYCGVDQRFYELAVKVEKSCVANKYKVSRYILTFATGDYRENFTLLPRVAKHLAILGVKTTLLIAGIRPGEQYVHQLTAAFADLGLSAGNHFLLTDFMGEDHFPDLVELYTAADFYLDMSLHEGFGMQLIEAMACGTTCMTSPMGALSEVAGGFAILIDPTKAIDVATAIEKAYANDLHLRDNALQIEFTKQYSWEFLGKTIAANLDKMAKVL